MIPSRSGLLLAGKFPGSIFALLDKQRLLCKGAPVANLVAGCHAFGGGKDLSSSRAITGPEGMAAGAGCHAFGAGWSMPYPASSPAPKACKDVTMVSGPAEELRERDPLATPRACLGI